MNTLHEWVADWIPAELRAVALADLQQRLAPDTRPVYDRTAVIPQQAPMPPQTETAVLNAVRLEAGRRGWRLFRNNCGAMQDKTGRVVRYGLANESKQMSATIKSGDLLGPVPLVIEPRHVGTTVGLFGSIEVKAVGARTDPDRLAAQIRWRDFVLSVGGYACITDGPLPNP